MSEHHDTLDAQLPEEDGIQRDSAYEAFTSIKHKLSQLDPEDRLRLNHMLAGLTTDFEKEIFRTLDKASHYITPQSYKSLMKNIVNHVIEISSGGGASLPEQHSRKRQRTDHHDDLEDPDRPSSSGPNVSYFNLFVWQVFM